ncbi:Reticulon-like protein [Rhynchospora pubera]|uniref:Reticulon-like protein n=1 Tax=Rhynchospora pubera TaxID=906938 RepID=A0AAV8CGQ0_9POAL|nr:Reticulon-like protein [Rhynchospora pubera]
MSSSGASTPRRRGVIARNGAPSSSIWETRIKMDEVKGGIKVFNVSENRDDEEGLKVYRRLRRNQSESMAEGKKRKSWKSTAAINSAQLRKSQSEISNAQRISVENPKEIVGGVKEVVVIGNGEKVEGEEMEVEKQIDQEIEREKSVDESHELEKVEDSKQENGSVIAEEICLEGMDVEDETPILEEKSVLEVDVQATHAQEKKVETRGVNQETKESLPEKKTGPTINNHISNSEPTKPSPEKKPTAANNERAVNPEPSPKASLVKKLASLSENRSINPEPVKITPTKSTIEKKVTQVINHRRAFRSESGKPIHVEVPYEEEHHAAYRRNYNRMQNIVDLVMWRDVSKSAFVFGLGTFMLVSSSYAKDLNFNLISATSYICLTYLGIIFTYRTILQRGANMDSDEGRDDGCILVGEEEAIWLLRLLLPYINEVLLKLRGLFSGDPATTMKLALLLFAMARCGTFLNLWTLAKLVFFGVFTIPKICSSYSTHLARYGKFWVERFRDGWEACTHKKAVVAALFTLFWNVSSTTARVWAVFMLVVAFKYYQQRMAEDWTEQDEVEVDEMQENPKKANQAQGNVLNHRQRSGPVTFEVNRERRVKKTL